MLSRCQIGILNNEPSEFSHKGRGENIKYEIFAFTELGVAMLSSVLRSDTAIEINRGIMRAFVELRRLNQLAAISATLSELQMQKRLQKPRRRIGYDVKPDEEYIE